MLSCKHYSFGADDNDLRNCFQYDAKRRTWQHRERLAEQTFPHPAQQIAAREYLDAVGELKARIGRITGRIRAFVPTWSMAPVAGRRR